MSDEITRDEIRQWIINTPGAWFHLDDIKKQFNISDSAYGKLRKAMHDFCLEGICEALGGRTGRYRRIDKDVRAVPFWLTGGSGDFPIIHPYGIDDNSHFGFETAFTFKRGSSYVIGGNTNAGKTLMAMNLCVLNMDNYHIKYFCLEASRYKYWDRIKNMDYVNIFKREGDPKDMKLEDCKFEFLPIKDTRYCLDYIEGADIYIIDWINLTDEIWKIGDMIHNMVDKVDRNGQGIIVAVLQKDVDSKFARGKTWSIDFADFGITLDYNRLTVLKCKPNSQLDNKTWRFNIIKKGSRFNDICEVVKCNKCHGCGKNFSKTCIACNGTGYVDKEVWDNESKDWLQLL